MFSGLSPQNKKFWVQFPFKAIQGLSGGNLDDGWMKNIDIKICTLVFNTSKQNFNSNIDLFYSTVHIYI